MAGEYREEHAAGGMPAPGPELRVLWVARKEPLLGGPSILMPILRELLQKRGIAIDLCFDLLPDPAGYDLAHVFNVWDPRDAVRQMRHLKQAGIPIVLSPIFLDLSETTWSVGAQRLLFSPGVDEAARANYLDAMANGTLMLGNCSRFHRMELFPGTTALIREIIELADHLDLLSIEEMQRISKCLGVYRHEFTVARNGADYALFENGSPEWFVATYGVRDFVICVGRIECRKNQAMLLHALRESNLPVVLVGRSGDPEYERICRTIAPPGTIFISHLDHPRLSSAYAAAKVYALPSWAEGAALTSIEAAAAGCQLVVSNRASEFEYFADCARYCDPADWRSIAAAVVDAYKHYERDKQKRDNLKTRLKASCTWEAAADATILAYRRTLAARMSPAEAM